MVYKLVSYKTILSKVERDFGISTMNNRASFIEWIGEALQDIGHHADTEMISCPVKVTDFRCPLPCNFDSLLAVEYRGSKLSLSGSVRSSVKSRSSVNTVDMRYPLEWVSTSSDGTVVLTEDGNIQSQTYYANVSQLPVTYSHFYMMQPDYLVFSMDEAEVILHYRGFVLDEEGFPKVPDTKQHAEAIAWYCLYKWLSSGNTHSVLKFADAYQMWIKNLGKASNRAVFPDLAQQERFTSMWVRLVRDNYAPDKFYKDTEQRQNIRGI